MANPNDDVFIDDGGGGAGGPKVLTLINGKLRVSGGSLVLSDSSEEPCCCNPFEYTIEICNSNSVTDDDWKVELNGTNIGTHSAPGMILAGTVWRTKDEIEVGCGEVTYKELDKGDFEQGQNNLRMEVTQLYNAANYGTVTINKWKYDRDQEKYVVDGALLSGEYTGPSEIGHVNEFNFNFP
jgi:hypothetical protein